VILFIVFQANASQNTHFAFSGIIISVSSHRYFFIYGQFHSKQFSKSKSGSALVTLILSSFSLNIISLSTESERNHELSAV
jgi:hypothetical protein